MAVLLAKTMGQLNEERRTVYPLFQKSSKLVKPQKTATLSIQHTSGGATEEIQPKSSTTRESRNYKKPTKDETTSSPNFSVIIPQHSTPDLLEEVDPNSHRRKRRKSASPDDSTAKISDASANPDVQGISQRRSRLSSPQSESAAPVEQDLASEPVAPEREDQADINVQERVEECTDQAAFQQARRPGLGIAGGKALAEKSAITTAHIETEGPRNSIARPVEKPRKLLQFNPKTGTIGSPPAKKCASSETINKPRSNVRAKQAKSKVVKIPYGHGKVSTSAIGLQIDQILDGSKKVGSSTKNLEKEARVATKPAEALNFPELIKSAKSKAHSAPLHPFFSGKPTSHENSGELAKLDATVIDLEVASLGRARTILSGRPPTPTKPRASAFTGFQGFGSSAKIIKIPGAIEPAWPWKGMLHVRGEPVSGEPMVSQVPLKILAKPRKAKYQAIEVLAGEDVVSTITADLGIDQVLKSLHDMNLDEYRQVPTCLRSPRKHFESGHDLQGRIRKELKAQLQASAINNDGESSEDEIQIRGSLTCPTIHPALFKGYNAIASSVTAFDQFRYETQPWAHKHSPKCAAEVLQTGKEPMILKEWLQKLTVMSVETGNSDRPSSRASSVSRSRPEKRRKKTKKLDGFVVSSEEEDNDMDEISEPEDEHSPRGRQSLLKKTVIRQGDVTAKGSKDPKLTNAVVISGPHGCGKTAAVYAVAKELGFEIFEINSSSRRSGKDILEKVGDMTRNHLVQRSHEPAPVESLDEDAQKLSDALADDIKSGRQGTMNSFFKPEDTANPKSKQKKQKTGTHAPTEDSKSVQASLLTKAPPKQQKQSLILFEEVDVLYEEDKQFWSTVISLITQSKRPIIMTCEDESMVPLQTLSLHAILRFTPPPVDLATDYMLLVAANEGHALERDAVKALYQSRHLDLRASLAELNFWCQFAVGDVRGGLDWLCPRWPPGCDVDRSGNTIRVVSEKTYEVGMGWLSQDFLESHMQYLSIEEETLHEAKDGWDVDLGNWQESIDMTGWASKMQTSSTEKVDNRARLGIYEEFAEAMSANDLFSGSAFASADQIEIDCTLPSLSDKAREDYLFNLPIVEATPLLSFDKTGLDISHWMKSRIRKYLQVDQHIKHGLEVPLELDRPSETHIIGLIGSQIATPESVLTRIDLSLAFDPISEPEKTFLSTTGQIEASVFDGTQTSITTDIAPYVRSIVANDAKLQQERSRMSNLLSEGGRKGKRMRTTRAAFSALEGGARSTTRKDRYFGSGLNPYLVLKTGLPSWLEALSVLTTATVKRSGEGLNGESGEDEEDA